MQQEGNKKMKTTSLSENSVTKSIKKFTSSYGIVVVMLLMIVVCSIISPNFLTKNNVLCFASLQFTPCWPALKAF